MEYRRKCNVCGKIYCYTDDDLRKNSSNSAMAAISAVGTIAAVFGGTRLDAYALDHKGDTYSSRVVDYNQCPSCHSKDTSLLSDEEWIRLKQEGDSEANFYTQPPKVAINSNASVESLLKRTKMFLEDKEWNNAQVYCGQILDIDPECAQAYVYVLMAELKVSEQDDLSMLKDPFDTDKSYLKAIRFGDEELKTKLEDYNNIIKNRNTESKYNQAKKTFEESQDYKVIDSLSETFKELHGYKDSADMIQACKEKSLLIRYDEAVGLIDKASSEDECVTARLEFEKLGDYRDSSDRIYECQKKEELLRQERIKQEKRIEEEVQKKKRGAIHATIAIALIVCACIVVACLLKYMIIPKSNRKKAIENFGEDTVNTYDGLSVGDTFVFGEYEQDNNTSNGNEPIEWVVLKKEGNKVFVISKYVLDEHRFDSSKGHNKWEECDLRIWLNEEFFNTAFNANEGNVIAKTHVDSVYEVDKKGEEKSYGNATTDKIYLLSSLESETYFPEEDNLKCKPTAYAEAKGASVYKGSTLWWFRSCSYVDNNVANSDGFTGRWDGKWATVELGVRPVMWIDFGY